MNWDDGYFFMKTCASCGGLHDGKYELCTPCLNFETLSTLLLRHCTPTEVDRLYQERVKPEQRVSHLLGLLDDDDIKAMLESFAEKETL